MPSKLETSWGHKQAADRDLDSDELVEKAIQAIYMAKENLLTSVNRDWVNEDPRRIRMFGTVTKALVQSERNLRNLKLDILSLKKAYED